MRLFIDRRRRRAIGWIDEGGLLHWAAKRGAV
jgi:hypothetical protein